MSVNQIVKSVYVYEQEYGQSIGIGTTVPSASLDVRGSINYTGDILFSNTPVIQGGTLAGTILPSTGVTSGSYGSGSTIPIISVDASGRITVASETAVTASQWTTGPSGHIYLSSFNVGIGTTQPLETLDIRGNILLGQRVAYSTPVYLAGYCNVVQPAADGRINGVNITALHRRTRPSYATAANSVITWYTRAVPSAQWRSVCWAPELGLLCAVSASAGGSDVATSADGTSWATRATPAGAGFASVCWAAELRRFSSVGNGSAMSSHDGISWTSHTVPNSNWRSVCWAPELGLFCAVGPNAIMTSVDGMAWTTRASPLNKDWYSVCWAPELGVFSVVSSDGTASHHMTSTNGTAWTTGASPLVNVNWQSVCWSPELGLFCAVGMDSGSALNAVMTSPDGMAWTTRSVPDIVNMESVCWAPELGMFCATGYVDSINGGAITSSDGIIWTIRDTIYYTKGVCWAAELALFCAVSQNGMVISTIAQPAPKSALLVSPSHMAVSQGDGFVGIGSTQPTNRLDVAGNISYTSNLMYGATPVFIGGTLNASSLPTTGVASATYGSFSNVPVIVVDATGRITGVTEASYEIRDGSITLSKLDPTAYNFQWMQVTSAGGGLRTSSRVIIDGDLILGGNLISNPNSNFIYSTTGVLAGPVATRVITTSNILPGSITFDCLDPTAYNFQWMAVSGGGLRTTQKVVIDSDLIIGGKIYTASNMDLNALFPGGMVSGCNLGVAIVNTSNLQDGSVTIPKVDFSDNMPVYFGGSILVTGGITGPIDASNITSGTLPMDRLPITGVASASYGSASSIPVLSIDVTGRVTLASNEPIAITSGAVSGLAPSATTNTTNATNITSGILPMDRLPITGVASASYGSASSVPIVAVDATGRVTLASNEPIAITSGAVSGLAGSATTDTTNATNITSGILPMDRLPITGVASASYGSASSVPIVAVDATGRVTLASNEPITIASGAVSGLAAVATSGVYGDLLGRPFIGEGGGFYTTCNIGIGVSAPAARLHVAGSVRVDGDLTTSNLQVLGTTTTIDSVTTQSSNFSIYNSNGTGPALTVSQRTVVGSGGLAAFYDLDVSQSVPVVVIADGGLVGIGSATPSQALDVVGSIRATSQLVSAVATGTAPLAVASTTVVTNLNADLLDGQEGSYYRDPANLSSAVPVNKGGTGQATLAANKVVVGNGTDGVLTPSGLHWDSTNNSLGIGTTAPLSTLHVLGGNCNLFTIASAEWYDRDWLLANDRNIDGIGRYPEESPYIATAGRSGSTTRGIEIGCTDNGYREDWISVVNGNGATNVIAFGTKNNERMRITRTGLVGIGTTNPLARLHIYEGATSGDLFRIDDVASGEDTSPFIVKADGRVGIGTINPANSLSINGGASIGTYSSTAAPTNGLIVSGNVGIGTTNPVNSLSVNGSASIGTYSSTAAPTNGVIVSGNVGIGITSPESSLHIAGVGTAATEVPAVLTLHNTHTSFARGRAKIQAEHDGTLGAGNKLTFHTRQDNGANFDGTQLIFERMCIKNNGNVGIGTTNPSAPLHLTATGNTAPNNNGLYIFNPTNSANQHAILSLRTGGGSGGNPFVSWDIAGVAGWTMGIDRADSSKLKIGFGWDSLTASTKMTIDTSGRVGINITNPGGLLTLKQTNTGAGLAYDGGALRFIQADTANRWDIGIVNGSTDPNFAFAYNGAWRGYFRNDGGNVNQNFTGQHRCFVKDMSFSNLLEYEGQIVSSDTNEYMSMSPTITKGANAITISESLPIVRLSSVALDKAVFGVISIIEDPEKREEAYGNLITPYPKEKGDTRAYINSVGEGAIWVSDMNGPLEAGDYITSSELLGYGMKQPDDILHNYTVAKITMDCDFVPQMVPKLQIKKENNENVLDNLGNIVWEPMYDDNGNIMMEQQYKMRYVSSDGTNISEEEYLSAIGNGTKVYRVAFVGCTYHCG